MLSLIRVRNYAVLDEVELELEPGFTVLTGETGAGKSLLVDALSLALGDRADASVVRQGAERAEIGVQFDCPADHPSLAWLKERGLDDGHSCVLRRLISAEGRSRAFINSHPVTLQDLRGLGGLLVDIHGQHAHQSLLDASVQRAILDAHGGHSALAAEVADAFRGWRDLEETLARRRENEANRESELELLRFQAAELTKLALADGELAALEAERSKLANVDKLTSGVQAALDGLYESDLGSAHAQLAGARQEIEKLLEMDGELAEISRLLEEAEIRLREAASDLARYRDRLEPEPARLEWVQSRLASIRALARRHAVSPDELPRLQRGLEERIAALEGGGEAFAALSEQARHAEQAYHALAGSLSSARAASARSLSQAVSAQLAELGLPHGEFQVALQPKPRERADATGLERVEFQVRLNPGQPFGPLSRMASGGELSRISLALEVVSAGATRVPTLVFDEVDAGIGGGVAEIVGRRLGQLAAERQVLCVTHLPQVASQGRSHYRIVKLTDGQTSRTQVLPLSPDERVEELSRMLGGVEITDRARAHAAEMIERAAQAHSDQPFLGRT